MLPVLAVFLATFGQAMLSSIISLVCAIPLVLCVVKMNSSMRIFFLSGAILVCNMPLVFVFKACQLLSIGGWTLLIVGHCLLNVPLCTVLLVSVLQAIDSAWQDVSIDSGGTQWDYWIRIVIPYVRPVLMRVYGLVFLLCFCSFSLPTLIGGAVEGHMIESYLRHTVHHGCYRDYAFLFCMKLLVLLVSGAFVIPWSRVSYSMQSGYAECSPQQVKYSRFVSFSSALVAAIVCGVLSSFNILLNTVLFVGSVAVVVFVSMALMVRWHRGGYLFIVFSKLIGIGTVCGLFLRMEKLGYVGAVLCMSWSVLPYAFAVLSSAMHSYNDQWSEAAYDLGASRWYVVRSLVVPHCAAALTISFLHICTLVCASASIHVLFKKHIGPTVATTVQDLKYAHPVSALVFYVAFIGLLTFLMRVITQQPVTLTQKLTDKPQL